MPKKVFIDESERTSNVIETALMNVACSREDGIGVPYMKANCDILHKLVVLLTL